MASLLELFIVVVLGRLSMMMLVAGTVLMVADGALGLLSGCRVLLLSAHVLLHAQTRVHGQRKARVAGCDSVRTRLPLCICS